MAAGEGLRCRWCCPLLVSIAAVWFDTVRADVRIVRPDNITEKVFIDYELTFTSAVPSEGIQGMVVVANPPDACTDLDPPPYRTNSSLKWFVLIERYPCPFETKVRSAQKAGFQAAIVYNVGLNSPHQSTRVVSPEAEIEIPGVLIGQDDGKKIKSSYTYSTGYTVVINPDTPFNLNTYLLPFAIVIGFCFLIMLLFMVVKCIKDRRRSRRNRLSSRHLKHLTTTKFKKSDKYEVCAVCLEDYCEGEKLRILPCSHAYHTKCIDPWLTNNRRNCPICKRKVAIPGVTPESDSDSDEDQDASETTPLLPSSNGISAAQQPPTSRTNGGTFSSSSGSSRSGGRTPGSNSTTYSPLLNQPEEPGPSSRNGSYREATQAQMHSPPLVRTPSPTSSSSSEEDIYHSSTQLLLAPNDRLSINGEEEDETPSVVVVVEQKAPKKSRTELVV